jgi:hypothetical protein
VLLLTLWDDVPLGDNVADSVLLSVDDSDPDGEGVIVLVGDADEVADTDAVVVTDEVDDGECEVLGDGVAVGDALPVSLNDSVWLTLLLVLWEAELENDRLSLTVREVVSDALKVNEDVGDVDTLGVEVASGVLLCVPDGESVADVLKLFEYVSECETDVLSVPETVNESEAL